MFEQIVQLTLVGVQPVKIHDSLYYQIAFEVEGQAGVQQTRINPEAFYPDPQVGDRVEATFLMGNLMGAKKLESVSNGK